MGVLQLAQSLSRDGSLEKAVELLEEHMTNMPNDLTVAAALGRLYMRLQAPEKAAYWLRYSLQSRYAPPDLDYEDIEYLTQENQDKQAFNQDSEFGVETDGHHAANDDSGLEDLNDAVMVDDDYKGVGEGPEKPLCDIPDLVDEGDQEQEPDFEQKGGNDSPTPEELSELLEDIPELDFQEDDEDEEYEFAEVPQYPLVEDQEDHEPASRLTVQEKAEGAAATLAYEAGWLRRDMDVLTEVLSHHKSHGKTVAALRRLLMEQEVTPQELETLHEIRQLWGGGGYNRTYYGAKAKDGWTMVSWPLVLTLVRQLRSDSAEEILLFVEDCFEQWSESPKQLAAFPIFVNYLGYVLEHMERVSQSCGQAMPPYIDYDFFEETDDGLDDWFEHRLTHDYLIIK